MNSASPPYPYMMEGPGEESRLELKDDNEATRRQLITSGLDQLSPAPVVVDAGAGVGVVAREMGGILASHYVGGRLILLDGSAQRLNTAAKLIEPLGDFEKDYIECTLDTIPLAEGSVDFVFCRFVFEYLNNPGDVFVELSRILKPGGKLVIGDLDHNSLNHYPLPDHLERQLSELAGAIETQGLMDLHAGRKLYQRFYQTGYKNIRVQLYAHHLFYGNLNNNDYENWTIKLDRLVNLQRMGDLSLSFDLGQFKGAFLEFLRSPERFSYTPLIVVEGIKPST